MSRRAQSLPPGIIEKPERSRCLTAICISWRVITCIVSHVTLISLVVAYCIGGALLFQHLEGEHELQVKREVIKIRNNITDNLWKMTTGELFLAEENWTELAFTHLEKFEKEILKAVKTQGWDGDEKDQQVQWTFFGALFYSIIVITTIGYGHIAPRTDWGKVTTIFYAILGIPLMLLCLSNIGDVMASSFRFIYWKICCYACTRKPVRHHRRSRINRNMGGAGGGGGGGGGFGSRQMSHRYTSRSVPPQSIRRSIRISQRSADSGFVALSRDASMIHAHSDPELRYNQQFENSLRGKKDWRFPSSSSPNPNHVYHQNEIINDYRDNDRMTNNPSLNPNYQIYQPKSPNSQRFKHRTRNRERLNERHSIECDRNWRLNSFDNLNPKRTQSSKSLRGQSIGPEININRVHSQTLPRSSKNRAKSVDPKYFPNVDDAGKTPILCNRYALEVLDRDENISSRRKTSRENRESRENNRGYPDRRFSTVNSRSLSVPQQPRYRDRLQIPHSLHPAPPSPPSPSSHPSGRRHQRYYDIHDVDDDIDRFDDEFEMKPIRKDRRPHSHKPAPLPPSPRIMSPMGFAVHRQARAIADDEESYYGDEWNSYGDLSAKNKPVPIWLCVFLVISYIIAGAFLFSNWEKWPFLDSVYFCFITLTTIGFGDFVPAQGVKENSKESIALCSLYLLFGISLLAMSFNLVQEEVITNVKEVARRLGILKEDEIDD